jgi:hypothetical protein
MCLEDLLPLTLSSTALGPISPIILSYKELKAQGSANIFIKISITGAAF